MIRALRRIWLPTLPKLDQYLLSLLLPGFVFGVTIFTTLALTVGTIFDLVRQIADAQLPLTILLQLIGYQLPTVLVLVFPMAVLLAVVGAMSRLSEEGEWVALRSVGICLRRVLVPVVVFALFVSGLTLALNEIAVPIAKYESQKLMRELLQQQRTLGSGTDIFYPEYDRQGDVRRLYYGHRFDGSRIQGITVLDFSQPQVTQVISAESAEWNVRESRWLLSQGIAYLISHTGVSRNLLQFDQQEIACLGLPNLNNCGQRMWMNSRSPKHAVRCNVSIPIKSQNWCVPSRFTWLRPMPNPFWRWSLPF